MSHLITAVARTACGCQRSRLVNRVFPQAACMETNVSYDVTIFLLRSRFESAVLTFVIAFPTNQNTFAIAARILPQSSRMTLRSSAEIHHSETNDELAWMDEQKGCSCDTEISDAFCCSSRCTCKDTLYRYACTLKRKHTSA